MTTTTAKETLQTILCLGLTPEQMVAGYMALRGRMEWSSLQRITRKKYIRPKHYYRDWERKQIHRYKRARMGLRRMKAMLLEIVDPDTAAKILCLLDRELRNHSYRDHASYLLYHPGSARMYGLDGPVGKSRLQAMDAELAAMTGPDGTPFMEWLVSELFARDADGSLMGDGTGFAAMIMEIWQSTKIGRASRRSFAKLHVLTNMDGKVVAAKVTRGRAGDAPQLKPMLNRLPVATQEGAAVYLDGAYESEEICRAIEDSGRIPMIRIRDNYRLSGDGARARMIRRYESDPIEYKKQANKRSREEAVFSSIKEKRGHRANARSLGTQRVSIIAKCIVYNLGLA